MRPTDNEPDPAEIEKLGIGEERPELEKPEVPEDVKSEILERIEDFEERDLQDDALDEVDDEP